MQITKTDLKQALEVVKPGISNKEVVEQSNAFAFMGDRIVTFNDEFSISHPTKVLNLTGAIKADELYNWISKVKKEEIEIEQSEGEIIFISGKSRMGLKLQDITLPVDEIGGIPKKGWKTLPENFVDALSFCFPCVSNDFIRPVLRCVSIGPDTVQASDSYKLARFDLSSPINDELLIPSLSVRELIKMKPVSYCKKESWVHFKMASETVFSCRLLEDSFPNTSGILEFEGRSLKLPVNLLDGIERANIFARNEPITLTFEKRSLKITSTTDDGWVEETANVKWDADPLSFQVTPGNLKYILSRTLDAYMNESRIRFDGEGWHYLSLLIKI